VLFNRFSIICSLSLLLLPCSPTHPFDLNCFVIADSLFVLSNSFISCQSGLVSGESYHDLIIPEMTLVKLDHRMCLFCRVNFVLKIVFLA